MANVKTFTENIDNASIEQINELISLPAFEECKIRIMPDVHAGIGCVIGFTADLGEKVIPNIVGVDIGCGLSVALLANKQIDFALLDRTIKDQIPNGFGKVHSFSKKEFDFSKLYCFDELNKIDYLHKSLGTLGSGNHFIECDVDTDGNYFLIIHTGSRNLGIQIAKIYQNKAIERCKGMNIPKALRYLEGKDRECYLHDMKICQEFAAANRKKIQDIICESMGLVVEDSFETIHNYISFEDNIVRKGAISAHAGERLIIPLNMRDGCILGTGKGNSDWNESAPHGAGRIMSRAEARKQLSLEDYTNTMEGIYSSSVVEETLDEAPFAYKPSGEIVSKIEDTVDIEKILKPVYNFKGF